MNEFMIKKLKENEHVEKSNGDDVRHGLDILYDQVLPQLSWVAQGGDGPTIDVENLKPFLDNIQRAVDMIENGLSEVQ